VATVTAFDAWLNEIIGTTRPIEVPQLTMAKLLDLRATEKYRKVAEAFFGKSIAVTDDLRLAEPLRHEVVHFLPYKYVISKETVPKSLIGLDKKRLFIDSGDSRVDFHFVQKLGSYALGYWVCQTLSNAAIALKDLNNATKMVGAGNYRGQLRIL